jgi:cobalt/nickel transport system ATP-binding protein
MNGDIFQLTDVVYEYPGGTQALNGITLSIAEGETVAILGANGSGKSTLLKLLDALYFPTRGEVRAFGVPLEERLLQDEEWSFCFRRRVGLVFQDPDVQLFLPTVRDEVAFAPSQLGISPEEVDSRVKSAMEELGISALADRPPYNLSDGEKKKVAIASVLSLYPDVWLLDEPTASLDPRTSDWMVRFILSLKERGRTVVIATHDLETARTVADRVCVLGEDHRAVAGGSPEEVLRNRDLLLRVNLVS